MTLREFEASLSQLAPPAGASIPLEALWHVAHDAWDRAHRLVQDETGTDAAWVHAHLHRVEGDLSNAAYWYRRAGRPAAQGDLAEERKRTPQPCFPDQLSDVCNFVLD